MSLVGETARSIAEGWSMMQGHTWKGRFRHSLIRAVVIGLIVAVVMVAAYVVARTAGIPFTTLTRDPAATLDAPWYVGALSNGVILVLFACAAIALFVWRVSKDSDVGPLSALLGWLGIGMMVLSLDDLYMVHEEILPDYLGISPLLLFAAYGIFFLVLVWRFGRTMVESTGFGMILLAGLFLAFSVALDVIEDQDLFELPFSQVYLEDPSKIIGMILASAYLVDTSRSVLRQIMTPEDTSPGSSAGEPAV